MDINALFTEEGLRAFTDAQRDQHMEDARQYGQIADIIQRRLKQTPIDGDNWFSARWRAWKVSRQVKAMEKASQNAASSAEGLYATYVNHVLEVPQQRELAANRKAERRHNRQVTAGEFVAKSLQKSAHQLSGVPAQAAGQEAPAPQYLDAQPFRFPSAGGTAQSPQVISDFFPKQANG